VVEHRTRSGPAGGGGPPAGTGVEARTEGCGPPPPRPETPPPAPDRATVPLVDDRALVAALVSGGPGGLAGVYDRYADRLFAYAVTLLRDRDAAADAVHDGLLVAGERAGQLRDPDRLRPWLYAIVRNECLRQLRHRRRAAPLEEAGDVIDETADVAAVARAAELRELVWSAAAALNPGEREVLELSVRHGLAGADLAAALGTSLNAAHALSSRARTQLERALGALLVARTGRSKCAELDALLDGWDGALTPLLRKRLARHVDRCETCGETRRHRLNPVALLAGVPFALAPPALRERILRDAGELRLVAHSDEVTGLSAGPGTGGVAAALAHRAGPWRPDGFPRPLDTRRRAAVWWPSAAAAVVLALLVVLGLQIRPAQRPVLADAAAPPASVQASGPPSERGVGPPATTTSPTTGTTTASAAPTAIGLPPTGSTATPPAPTRTTALPPTGTTTRPPTSPPTTPPTTRPPTTTPAPGPTVTLGSEFVRAACPEVWYARLTATVTGTVAESVQATWSVPGGSPQPASMTPGADGVWFTTVALPADTAATWTAIALAESGGTRSAPATLFHACPAG